MSISYDEDVSC